MFNLFNCLVHFDFGGIYRYIYILAYVPPNGGVSSMEPAAGGFHEEVKFMKLVHLPNKDNALYYSSPSKVWEQHIH
jgi:hypothetical protein